MEIKAEPENVNFTAIKGQRSKHAVTYPNGAYKVSGQ